MIGIRAGLALGLRTGVAAGLAADPIRATTGTSTTQTVSVTDSADPVITGADAFSYTVQYTNTGAATANSVSVVVTLDASLAYVSASGTGWSISQNAGVVTCTRATAAVGAAPAITVNVTTGTSALTASTSAQATASNAGTANGSQTTTVQLVSKDASGGKYVPASSTEWTNFIARKGLSVAVPDSLHLLQEASGSPADSIGAFPLTVVGTPTYSTAATGWTRVGISFTDGQAAELNSTSASLPSITTNSCTTLLFAIVTATAGARAVIQHGTTTVDQTRVNSTGPHLQVASGVNTATGTGASPVGAMRPYGLRTNRTSSTTSGNSDAELLTPTFGSPTNKKIGIGSNGNTPAMNVVYAAHWFNANAEITDANWRALLQALGWTVGW